eukprot:COSAG01_NODE_22506_length_852_cov_2.240372_1_plen_252_part_10
MCRPPPHGGASLRPALLSLIAGLTIAGLTIAGLTIAGLTAVVAWADQERAAGGGVVRGDPGDGGAAATLLPPCRRCAAATRIDCHHAGLRVHARHRRGAPAARAARRQRHRAAAGGAAGHGAGHGGVVAPHLLRRLPRPPPQAGARSRTHTTNPPRPAPPPLSCRVAHASWPRARGGAGGGGTLTRAGTLSEPPLLSFETRKTCFFIVSVGVVCADCADCAERWRVAGGQSVVKTWMSRTSTALAADAGAEA